MICTFYSYKGGVGRSMALANVADILARKGLRVLMIDFDLEAPGLEQYFPISQPGVRRHLGLLDLLLNYKRSMSVGGSETSDQSFRQLRENFIVPVYTKLPEGARLDLLPSGQREGAEQLTQYALNLRVFDWQDFYFNWEGELFFEWMRRSLVRTSKDQTNNDNRYDLVLVDSRTGVTEMGGVCAYQLADTIVMLCAANRQNVEGTRDLARDFFSPRVRSLRGDRPLEVIVVPARIELRDNVLLESFRQQFNTTFAEFIPLSLRDRQIDFWKLLIPYEPRYAFEEQVVVRPSGQDRQQLAGAFGRLAEALTFLAEPGTSLSRLAPNAEQFGSVVRKVDISEPQYDVTRRFAGYHAFLSYTSTDKMEVRRLADVLISRDLNVFMDETEMVPGDAWQARIEDAITHSDAALFCLGQRGLGPSQQNELRLALEVASKNKHFQLISVLLPGVNPDFIPELLREYKWIDLREGFHESEIDALVSMLRQSQVETSTTVDMGTPYVGLQPFEEKDAKFYFGREQLVAQLVDKLSTSSLIAIIGPSGCGKTSLVQAGLFPELRRGALPGSEQWLLAKFRPGSQPISAIVAALRSLNPDKDIPDYRPPSGGSNGTTATTGSTPQEPVPACWLITAAESLLSSDPKNEIARRRLVLFVGHFEEAFTTCDDEELRGQFIDELMNAVDDYTGIVIVILSLRADFLDRAYSHARLAAKLKEHRFDVPTLNGEELRAAIEKAAQRVGCAFEPGLVERIIRAVESEPGALPLLQYSLPPLWDRRQNGWLTNKAYDEFGGVDGVLSQKAEQLFQELTPYGQTAARQIFLRLVQPGEGTDFVRRRAIIAHLQTTSGITKTLQTLIDASLVVASADYDGERAVGVVELAHKSLMSSWTRLHEWLKEDREFLQWQQKLRNAVQLWLNSKRDRDTLLRGAALADVEKWLTQRRDALSSEELEFIRQSQIYSSLISDSSERSMNAFIIRPFGKRKVANNEELDFDAVEAKLIDPALTILGISGRTTGEILAAGNIRTDMFQKLLTADLVIADVSLHNANVFYELGIRHALRDKRTFLLRCNVQGHDIPFDLKTDRYFTYDQRDPAAILDRLAKALRETLDSDNRDSPVFQQLPNLKAQDPSNFLVVPGDFHEDVNRAMATKQFGDLELLAAETNGFEWEVEGLRVVGRAQFNVKAYAGAKSTWEAIRKIRPFDTEANLLLGTIFERLGDFVGSDQAIQRALDSHQLEPIQCAEAYALRARNAKTRWRAEWSILPESERRANALRSAYLMKSFEEYETGFQQDVNHFFSGLNAAGMLTIIVELAKALPDVWAESFDSETEAKAELDKLQSRLDGLYKTVEFSLLAQAQRLKQQGKQDIWFDISRADLYTLTGKNPRRVAQGYREAFINAQDFHRDAAGNQLGIYEQLGVRSENVSAALEIVGSRGKSPQANKRPRVLLFTGHRIDSADRKTPRFPGDKEHVAREAIKEVIQKELALADGIVIGIAGGASGGDILFHQICAEFDIPTQVFLALPQDQYSVASVQSAGPAWIERYNALCQRLPPRVLGESRELPRWLRPKQNYDIWRRTNLWMLHNAIAQGGTNVTLIALWDGQGGDGPGGTEDMVRQAQQLGAKPIILDTKQLFGLKSSS